MAQIERIPFGRVHEFTPEHPERTSYRYALDALDGDVTFKVWPSRGAMLTAIRMQGRRAPRRDDWRDYSESRWAKRERAQRRSDGEAIREPGAVGRV